MRCDSRLPAISSIRFRMLRDKQEELSYTESESITHCDRRRTHQMQTLSFRAKCYEAHLLKFTGTSTALKERTLNKSLADMKLWIWRFPRVLARKCHMQAAATVLFCLMSSSGGGLPGRPELERVRGACHFWCCFHKLNARSSPSAQSVPECTLHRIFCGSVGGDREIDSNVRSGLNGQ